MDLGQKPILPTQALEDSNIKAAAVHNDLAVTDVIFLCLQEPSISSYDVSKKFGTGLLDQICLATEICVSDAPRGAIGILPMLSVPTVRQLLLVVPEHASKIQTLRAAVKNSKMLKERGAEIALHKQLHEASCSTLHSPHSTPTHLSVRQKIAMLAISRLQCMTEAVQQVQDIHGWVPAQALLDSDPELARRCFNSCQSLLLSVQASSHKTAAVNMSAGTVRLLSLLEKLCVAVEEHFLKIAGPLGALSELKPVSMSEVVSLPAVQHLLGLSPSNAGVKMDTFEFNSMNAWHHHCPQTTCQVEQVHQHALLRAAIEQSAILGVSACPGHEAQIKLGPPLKRICQTVGEFLSSDRKAKSRLEHEGEVALSWVAEQPQVQAFFSKLGVRHTEVVLQALQFAISTSSDSYIVEGEALKATLRAKETSHNNKAPHDVMHRATDNSTERCTSKERTADKVKPPTRKKESKTRGSGAAMHAITSVNMRDESSGHAAGRHVRALRQLLVHYFSPFNLQLNRLLMLLAMEHSTITQTPHAYTVKVPLENLRFRMAELALLPRVSKCIESCQNSDDVVNLLSAAVSADSAMPGDQPLPVRIASATPVGARSDGAPSLELNYSPQLRFLAVASSRPRKKKQKTAGLHSKKLPKQLRVQACPELDSILFGHKTEPHSGCSPLPPHACIVISYSLSSDLSHGESPKAVELQHDICNGELDPEVLTWEHRILRLKRELLHYEADIICVQALQSVGSEPRCSESDPRWFSCDEEPTVNHLVLLYRELSKANYAVAYAPTVKIPGNSTLNLGNAVFWKRSRWNLVRHFAVLSGSACSVELTSKCGGPHLLVSSAKTAASYVLEWGEEITERELLTPIQRVAEKVTEEAQTCLGSPVLCGDFGCEPEVLRSGIAVCDAGDVLELPSGKERSIGQVHNPQLQDRWQSACASLLSEEPWTTASLHQAGAAVDYILHKACLRTLAVLAGRPSLANASELFRTGFASDHLLQLAALTDNA